MQNKIETIFDALDREYFWMDPEHLLVKTDNRWCVVRVKTEGFGVEYIRNATKQEVATILADSLL